MVKWSRRARADLKAIHDRIALDAPDNAKAVAREIVRKADTLAALPYAGRKVPETNDDRLREIPAYSWRILYHVREGQVFVVTLMHKRRDPSAEEIGSAVD
jgi:plasmid stabilization system protein ParE